MAEKLTYTAPVTYHPSPDNYAFLVDQQAEKKKTGPLVGFDRILDQIITKVRKASETDS